MSVDLVVELYIDGYPISVIAEELMLSEDEVLTELRSYKKKQDNGKDYVYDFKEMIVERIMCGVKKASISKELGVAYKTINKYLEEFLVEVPKSKKALEEKMYEEINWASFTRCPCCRGTNVNDLNIYKEEGLDLKHSYCLSCGTEWEQKDNKVFKINWEYVE